ncbi:MAG: diaminopimelate epimerase [Aestuariivirgaceae bacterium]
MTGATTIRFRKMNGLGNDFVVLDARTAPLQIDDKRARAIADRTTGIGCDQLIVLEPSAAADVRMRIWNSAGDEVESCGNASRCIADLLFRETGRPEVKIDTDGGLLHCTSAGEGLVTVDMGVPRFGWRDIPLSEEFRDTRHIELQVGPIDAPILHSPSVVNVGNPHCIFWVKDLSAYDLGRLGPMLEHHPLFPERANISLAQVLSRERLALKVWERGAGLTRACGTGACAAAVAGARINLLARKSVVALPGGELLIEWRKADDHILMTGPFAYEFEGELPERLLTVPA